MKKSMFFIFLLVLVFQSCAIVSIKETNTLESIVSQLDDKFNKSVGKNIPGAVIIFIKNGEIYYQQAFGYKDKENDVIMTEDANFQVASISKYFCALGIMKYHHFFNKTKKAG
jgi:CubicO group peptidase (beta-lactamase class C family)